MVKYYFFGGQRIAMLRGTAFSYLHSDHLGSTVMETVNGAMSTDQKYFAYGKQRDTGTVVTDHRFTGQKLDSGSGLIYMKARYYDPSIGMFISPDTIVPNPGLTSNYNRYLAFRGNPLKFVDPTGHFSEEQLGFLGITKNSVSEGIWKFLLALQPEDTIWIPRLDGNDIKGTVKILASDPEGDGVSFGLYINDKSSSLASWLSEHQGDLGYMAEIWRDDEKVYDRGKYTDAKYAPNAGQSGIYYGKNGSRWNRFTNGLVGELMGPISVLFDTFEGSCHGCEEGDFQLSFQYWNNTELGSTYTTRTFTYRHFSPKGDDPFVALTVTVDEYNSPSPGRIYPNNAFIYSDPNTDPPKYSMGYK